MISHSEAVLDHDADSRQGPPLGLEARAYRPPLKDVEEFLPLLGRQPRRSPRFGAALQRCEPVGAVSQSLGPLADGHPADAQSASDLGLRETAGAEPAARDESALFELFGGEFVWSPQAYDRRTGREIVKRLT